MRGWANAPDLSAKGAKCNSLGQRPRVGSRYFEALKARNRKCRPDTSNDESPSLSSRAFSAKKPHVVAPGPMAQAITLRAFGAENPGFYARLLRGLVVATLLTAVFAEMNTTARAQVNNYSPNPTANAAQNPSLSRYIDQTAGMNLATKKRKNPMANEAHKAPIGAREIWAVGNKAFCDSSWPISP